MVTPVFDIINNEPAAVNWQLCRLFIEINPAYFYYTVIDDNNSVAALKYYQLSYNNNQQLADLLEDTVNQDPVLQEKMNSCHVIFNWPEYCLIPDIYFDTTLNKEMLGLMNGFQEKAYVLNEKVNDETHIVYSVPSLINEFLQRRFPGCDYKHFYTRWLDLKWNAAETIRDHVDLVFNPKEITAVVFFENKLMVIQNLPYQTPEDVAWQLLNIYKQFNLSQESVPLVVSGMIDQNSAVYEELLNYFLHVEMDTMPADITLPEQFQSFPGHFFSPLLKLALCVS